MPSIWTSVVIMGTLAVIFAACWTMFWVLVGRSTDQRQRVTFSEWGRERGFRFRETGDSPPPPPLDRLPQQRISMQTCLTAKQAFLLVVQTDGIAPAAGAVYQQPRTATWNLLLRKISIDWPPTGLRPVGAAASALDLFSLTSFPLAGSSDRFLMYGTAAKAAAALSRSSARGLLPPDIGLLLHGQWLVLDFSTRPFDTVEFERMIAVAEQIAAHLPAPEGTE